MDLETGDDVIALKESVQDMAEPTDDGSWFEDADEYARNAGLTVDSRNWPPNPGLCEKNGIILSTLVATNPGELIEFPQAGLPECAFRTIIPPSEEVDIPQQAIDWVENIVKASDGDKIDVAELTTEILLSSLGTFGNKFLKFEEPYLRSDPAADRRALANKLAAFRQTLTNHRLPLHPVSIEDDEGLEFPATALRGDKSVMDTIKAQNYEDGAKIKAYCREMNKTPWSDDQQRELVETTFDYHGLNGQAHVTPPLSPRYESHTMSPEESIPDEEVCLISDAPHVVSKPDFDLETVKKDSEEDNAFSESVAQGETCSPKSFGHGHNDLDISGIVNAGEIPPHSQDPRPLPEPESLKLDIPLLPDETVDDPGNEPPQRIVKPKDSEEAKELIKSDNGPVVGNKGLCDFLGSNTEKLTRSPEQEKLSAVCGITKLSVPDMDFSAPEPDWSKAGCDTPEKRFAWIKEHTQNWGPMTWPSNKAADQRMEWAPVPHIQDIEKLVAEQIEVDDSILSRFTAVAMDHELMSSADCVAKAPGFAILGKDDYDDELLDEDWNHERKTGISGSRESNHSTALPGKERMQGVKNTRDVMSGKKHAREEPDENDSSGQISSGPRKVVPKQDGKRISSQDSQVADLAMIDAAFILKTLLDDELLDDHSRMVERHIKLHNSKKPKINSRFFGSSQQPEPDDEGEEISSQDRKKKEEEDARSMPPPPKPILALGPSFTLPDIPPNVIIASSVSGLLVMELRNLIPGIGIVFRDYDKRRPRGWYPGLRSPNLDEADITLSPATGVLLTTMVKLRQKTLPGMTGPGQGNNNAGNFRRVVENVAERYERLVVFISEGNKHSETITPLPVSDANALVEFQGFAAGLSSFSSCDISVIYLGGGNETLAKWVAATICQYTNEAALVEDPLLAEETCWELFLRRAGMNPFAAQDVLGALKGTCEEEDEQGVTGGDGRPLRGLPLFVVMTTEERIRIFEDVFRGRKVLNRVSEVIEQVWARRAEVGEMKDLPGRSVPMAGGPRGLGGGYQN